MRLVAGSADVPIRIEREARTIVNVKKFASGFPSLDAGSADVPVRIEREARTIANVKILQVDFRECAESASFCSRFALNADGDVRAPSISVL